MKPLAISALLLLAPAAAAAAEMITPIGFILANRDRLNGRSFCVVGIPVEMRQRFGEVTNKHLFRGKLSDGTGELILFSYGSFPILAAGEKIEACGRFDKFYVSPSKKTYRNQLKASVILKGPGIAAGLVQIVGDQITVAKKPAVPAP